VNEKVPGIICMLICFAIGCIGTGVYHNLYGAGRTGSLDGIAEANAAAAERIVAGLNDTVTEQRTVIGDLTAENQRLTEYLRDASRISESLAGTVETSGTYTAGTVEVSKRLRKAIMDLENWYNNLRREYPWIDMSQE